MPNTDIKTKLKFKRGSNANLSDIVLADGEPCYDKTNKVLKVGDGTHDYNNLPGIYTTEGLTKKPLNSIGFDANGIAISTSSHTLISAGSFHNDEHSLYISSRVSEISSGCIIQLPTLEYLYIDNFEGNVTLPNNIPASVTIYYIDEFNFNDLMAQSIKATYKQFEQSNIINSVIEVDNKLRRLYTINNGFVTLEVPYSVTQINDNTFKDNPYIEKISILPSLTYIGARAFYNCTKLQAPAFQTGITSIQTETYAYCSRIETFKLPIVITSIGERAFYNCTRLRSIDMTWFTTTSTIPTLNTDAFDKRSDLKFIFASQAVLDLFAADTNWAEYADQFEVES